MQTVLVASSKGGCGKSTLVTNLAACHAQKGRRVTVVDADPQASSFTWCARRPDTLPGVLALEGPRQSTFDQVPADTDVLLIDSPAGIQDRMLEPLLEHADAVLVPVLPSIFDFDASAAFTERLAAVSRIRRGKLPVALVANRLKPWTRASQEALNELRQLPFPVAGHVRDSQAYVLLSGLGKGIFDYHSEYVRGHQQDWRRLLNWLKRNKNG
ncbi:MAG TPA: ParA family protein [Rhodanobacteraceae bacterium]|nr:ParA family protein [Rhodanobacteraceae bacterium]